MLEHWVEEKNGDGEDERDPETAPKIGNHVGVVAGMR
jgi:hypothetical protein